MVADVQHRSNFGNYGPMGAAPGAYIPVSQVDDDSLKLAHVWFSPSWIVRSSRPQAQIREAIESVTHSVDPLLPISGASVIPALKITKVNLSSILQE